MLTQPLPKRLPSMKYLVMVVLALTLWATLSAFTVSPAPAQDSNWPPPPPAYTPYDHGVYWSYGPPPGSYYAYNYNSQEWASYYKNYLRYYGYAPNAAYVVYPDNYNYYSYKYYKNYAAASKKTFYCGSVSYIDLCWNKYKQDLRAYYRNKNNKKWIVCDEDGYCWNVKKNYFKYYGNNRFRSKWIRE